MEDRKTMLKEIKERVLEFARERDWEQFHSPKNLSMAISAESAELMEHFLWQSSEASCTDLEDFKLRSKVEEELADIFIFAIEFNSSRASKADAWVATIVRDKRS